MMTWGANNQKYIASNKDIFVGELETNTEWEYLESSVNVESIGPTNLSSIKFRLHVRRRPFYQIVHTFIPIVLLSYMNSFVFILPINSGENTSFGVAIFLAFAVFIGPVKDSLPVTSTETCLFTVFLIVQFCLGGFETCLSNITLRLASRKGRVSVKSWWLKLHLSRKTSVAMKNDEHVDKNCGSDDKTIGSNISTDGKVDLDWMALGSHINMIFFCLFIFIKSVFLVMFLRTVMS
ncbi:Acetylcholine receptor subunit beta [Mizuhopecten yessoensis]|uniref:Acetylcholine receptor subunit beta n=1 Tax=Mizuhopecten yessoensis TaxID=6573 RepID=A0A210QH54_MIZYE|nr:Acetylcholine receptor subunit beta [Mizuhopecten yessoensis]